MLIVCFANKNKNCQLSYSWFQTSQTGDQRYSDTSPFSIPCSKVTKYVYIFFLKLQWLQSYWQFFFSFHWIEVEKHIWEPCCPLATETGGWLILIYTLLIGKSGSSTVRAVGSGSAPCRNCRSIKRIKLFFFSTIRVFAMEKFVGIKAIQTRNCHSCTCLGHLG